VEAFCRAWNAAPTPWKMSLTEVLQETYGGQTIPVISGSERKRRQLHEMIRRADSSVRDRGRTATDAEIARALGVSRATVVRVANSPDPKGRAEDMQKLADAFVHAVCPHANLTVEQIVQRIYDFIKEWNRSTSGSTPSSRSSRKTSRRPSGAEMQHAADTACFLKEQKRLTTKASS
jgi:hypothetical protein